MNEILLFQFCVRLLGRLVVHRAAGSGEFLSVQNNSFI